MSAETVTKIIGRAVNEPEYRELLFSDPAKALEGYELTEEESAGLKGLSREGFDAVANELGERVSRAGLGLPDSSDPNKLTVKVGRIEFKT